MATYFNAKQITKTEATLIELSNGLVVELIKLDTGSLKATTSNGLEAVHGATDMRLTLGEWEQFPLDVEVKEELEVVQYIYARVSTQKQNLEPQVNELLKAYPNAQLVREKASGKDLQRTEFELLNDKLNQGDTVIVYDLSRLGRNTGDLINLVEDWNKRGIGLIVQNLGGSVVDTSTATGKLMFTVLAAVGQMQREIQQEKAQLGIERAVSEGKFKGKQQSQATIKACKAALEDIETGFSKEKAAKANGVGIATLYRYIKDNK